MFIKRLFANLFDEVLVAAITAAIFGITIGIMDLLGWKFKDNIYVAAAFIMFGVVNLLYYPIVEAVSTQSLGKKLLKVA